MADFALWATAAEEALGFGSGAFMSAHSGNRAEAMAACKTGKEQAISVDNKSLTMLFAARNRPEQAKPGGPRVCLIWPVILHLK